MFKGFLNLLFRFKKPLTRTEESAVEIPLFSLKRAEPEGFIDPQLDNWPEWPTPDWDARRVAVLRRDNFICQAPGCLTKGMHLNAHHIRARWEGGNHQLENLVALCPIHHAIVHLDTNAVRVNDDRCQIVSKHWRRRRFSAERYEVKIHVRRKARITPEELSAVRHHYGLVCNLCGNPEWKGNYRKGNFWRSALIETWCPTCNARWNFEPGLLEETATQLVLKLKPTKPLGRFQFSIDLIQGLRPPVFFEGCPECLRHGRRGHLKEKHGRFGRFLGCSEWPACSYTRSL